MNENRFRILEMLAEGRINAHEAECLLGALDEETAGKQDRPGIPPDRCIRCLARLATKLERRSQATRRNQRASVSR